MAPRPKDPMPSRVIHSIVLENSTPSESENSFVSAESENKSRSNRGSHIGQSAATLPSSPRRCQNSIPPTNSTNPSTATNANSETSKLTDEQRSRSQIQPAPLPPPARSYFAQQPFASGIEPRSPQNKRPPASRSSHGIETSSGPPPAISTRRSYTAKPNLRGSPPSGSRAIHPPLTQRSNTDTSIDSVVRLAQSSTHENTETTPSDTVRITRLAPSTNEEIMTTMEEDQDPTLRIKNQKWEERRHSRNEDLQQQSLTPHEDLFLNLARADSVVGEAGEPMTRSDRRRSRMGSSSLYQMRTSRPLSSGNADTTGGSAAEQQTSRNQHHDYKSSYNSSFNLSAEKDSLPYFDESASKARPYAAYAHPLDQRHRTRNPRTSSPNPTRDISSQEQSPEVPTEPERRQSIRDASSGFAARAYKQSNLSYTSNGNYGSSPFSEQPDTTLREDELPQATRAEDTESTLSTTAPSTVWDELDDLKSRIRKLELTGKLPTSSNAAMSTNFGERPPTATTTMTTISSSPKRRQADGVSPEASTIRGLAMANVHPLLHSALAKTKPAINQNLYRALEATALDALILAAMTGSSSSPGLSPHPASVVAVSNGIDRQLRRKADSMCRSLTELCIALAENKSEAEASSISIRPRSRDAALPVLRNELKLHDSRFLRATSDDPEPRSSSRMMSRLEARRTSLLLGSSPLTCRDSPQDVATSAQIVAPLASRLDRTSSAFLRARAGREEDGDTSARRPPSRATTEISQTRPSPQTRVSREYTSQHPMPSPVQRSPSVQSSLPTRRSYFRSASQSPITPSMQPGNRKYLDRSTPPSSADSARLVEARQRRIASLSQHVPATQSRIGIPSGRLKQSELDQQR